MIIGSPVGPRPLCASRRLREDNRGREKGIVLANFSKYSNRAKGGGGVLRRPTVCLAGFTFSRFCFEGHWSLARTLAV